VCSLYELVEGMVADAVLADAAARQRTVPGRYSAELAGVDIVANRACRGFGKHSPDLPAAADEAAQMKAGLLLLEPALKRFIYRELQEQSELNPTDPLWVCAAYQFPWQVDVDEATAMQALPADVHIEHSLALWEELRKRLGVSA